jgi:hypothetical protein
MSAMNIGMKNGEILLGPRSRYALQPTDPAAEDDPGLLAIVPVAVRETGIGHRLHRRRDGILGVVVGALRFLAIHEVERVEVLHLGGESDGELRGVELRDRRRPRAALDERTPGRRHVVTDGRDSPEASDDDPTLHALATF